MQLWKIEFGLTYEQVLYEDLFLALQFTLIGSQ